MAGSLEDGGWGGPPGGCPMGHGTPKSRLIPGRPARGSVADLGTGVKIRPFGQSQAARRDVAQTLVSAAPRLISALFVHEQEARQECRAGRLKPAPRRVGDQFRPCNGLILTPMPRSAADPLVGLLNLYAT